MHFPFSGAESGDSLLFKQNSFYTEEKLEGSKQPLQR